jgi:uncharacterized protein YraI
MLKETVVKNIFSSSGSGFKKSPPCSRIWIMAVFFLLPVVFPLFAEVTSVPGTVTGDRVNMRVSPGLRSEVVGQLEKGQEIQVLLTDGEWCAIIPPVEISAWVSAQYVKDGLVTGRRVNARSGPGVSYGRLTYLREGTSVTVLEEKGGWVKINLPRTGRLWVNSRYIEQTPSGIPAAVALAEESDRGERPVSSAVGVDNTSSPGAGESIAVMDSPAVPVSSATPIKAVTSSPALPAARTGRSVLARSYSGYIEKLDQPFSTADSEYAYKLLKKRFDSRPLAYLSGDTIDLKKYLSRKVRLWAVVVEKKENSPDLMEVKGVGFLW